MTFYKLQPRIINYKYYNFDNDNFREDLLFRLAKQMKQMMQVFLIFKYPNKL